MTYALIDNATLTGVQRGALGSGREKYLMYDLKSRKQACKIAYNEFFVREWAHPLHLKFYV